MDIVKESLLKATVATLVVLSVGVLAGMQVDGARANYLEQQVQDSTIRSETFLVTQSYLEESSRNYCQIVDEQIPRMAKENAQIGRNLQSFEGRSRTRESDFKYLKRRYYINQLRLYNLLSGYEKRCEGNITRIFFFFDSSVQSKRQGAVLTDYRKDNRNSTYIFSYNLNTANSTVLEILKTDYGIQEGPSIVINGNETYRRYVSLKELERLLE